MHLRTFCLVFPALALGKDIYQPQNVSISDDPYYPREPVTSYSYSPPNATGSGWEFAFARAKRFVSQLTIEEKVGLCTGNGYPPGPNNLDLTRHCQGGVSPIPRLNFSGLCYLDSDTGIGNSHSYGTGFPPGVTAASTWNRELIRARAFAIATELRAKGVHSVLGPVLALARTIVGGTNFEGFGAEPYLIGVAGYETVIGHQGAGVQAEPKQFLGYEGQQYARNWYSSNMDSKTLHEILVWPYAEAVRAGAACVMTSYPSLNNTQASANAYLQNDILKTHLGFQGYTQTDWIALDYTVKGIMSGTDQDMPGFLSLGEGSGFWSHYGENYTMAVKNGSVPEWRLTDAALRILTPYFLLGQDRNYPQINVNDDPRQTIVDAQRHNHQTIAQEVAAAGTVLLKNTPGRKGLPLVKPTTISLFGPAAGQNPYGPNQYGYGFTQGTLAEGGGSGTTFYPRLVDPISALTQRARQDLTSVDWTTSLNLTFAAAIARRGTVCLPVVSSFSGERYDRPDLKLTHDGDNLIKTVADNCDNTIVVVQSVGPVDMEAWVDHPNVTAVVWANLAGQELGAALVDILYGNVNPSGRLVYTIARNASDYAQAQIVKEPYPFPQLNYTEGVSIDYRGFEKNGLSPRFWFGHGLSYSTFTYSALEIHKQWDISAAIQTPINYVADAPGGDARLYNVAVVVILAIHNDGPYDGNEVPQLYLQMPAVAQNPTKVLRGFDNVKIRDGETQTVHLYLTRKDISYWDTVAQTWTTPQGLFGVQVGASSSDIRLTGNFTL
ncbi:glycoside hydrolase family 3 protein [Zasmidium cellare ATCC 36951]|uniref:Probable beta-glucosidase G n=1 Tax=Zasmidium cellare ATCC 36951 TaxID=1080233 RepID=A0A6A6C6Q0_ZASCE|nr:glycoside hydrolase family 3 protein [Zasmidium cellare ATCC 36951]KAF2161429.1 glycoside hydrolase family 3 protein [Zasmidium cellare ATCC 36951]